MRAFAGGYYRQLKAMYEYLGVSYHARRFLFCFSRFPLEGRSEHQGVHFIHSSNNHRFPPIKPRGLPLVAYILEITYLFIWYSYFSLCCFFIEPRIANKEVTCESVEAYTKRIRLPRYFTERYLLPLMSSVATCSHSDLLGFPARDLTEYKRQTSGAEHYVVSHGIREVQCKLIRGLDIRVETQVISVKPEDGRVRLSWRTNSEFGQFREDCFDSAILAVSPAVVGAIFEPLHAAMAQIPIRAVTSVVHKRGPSVPECRVISSSASRDEADIIAFRTSQDKDPRTESLHIQRSDFCVTTCPLLPVELATVIAETSFTRVLRTPKSRKVVKDIFSPSRGPWCLEDEKRRNWRNGDGNVWLAGGWCWDGMVLLEGCVVSAMKVADAFGVKIPWRDLET